MPTNLPEHVQRNRSAWDDKADDFGSWAPRAWARDEPTWGEFNIPDAELGALPRMYPAWT